MTELPYNPLDKANLAASVAEALLLRPVKPLKDLPVFDGAGIYAIYYTGSFNSYARISERNRNQLFQWPIYVGKAVPAGARKALSNPLAGRWLHARLREHLESIQATKNLEVDCFFCRYLILDDIWIPLGESLLIGIFSPVWNRSIDGFGNHDPGAGRYQGLRPRWDVLHPGRAWAEKCKARAETAETISTEIETRLRTTTPPAFRISSLEQPPD